VLVTGGVSGGDSTNGAELYDPATGDWSPAAPMQTLRSNHAAVLLNDGRVLVAGGLKNGTPPTTAEIYNPATNTWTTTGSTVNSYRNPVAIRLQDGRVLLVGGVGYDGYSETYDPLTGKWTRNQMQATRTGASGARLRDGRVLVQGGTGNDKSSSELFDPRTNTWTATGHAHADHSGATMVSLPDGRAVLAGGTDNFQADDQVEIYDDATGTWSLIEPLAAARYHHAAVVLGDGSMLAIAGRDSTSGPGLRSSERYFPASMGTPVDPDLELPISTPTPEPTATATPEPVPTATPQPPGTPLPKYVPAPKVADPRFAKLPKTLKAGRSGAVRVSVTCMGNSTCKGEIVLRLGKATFARARFTLAPSKSGSVTLKLSKGERRRLAKRGTRATLVLGGRRTDVQIR
jgi:hypothetical protein